MNGKNISFKSIGKVFKYDFISATKSFVPIFGITLALGLINGLFTIPAMGNHSTNEVFTGFLQGLLLTTYFGLLIAGLIIYLTVTAKRFNKTMLCDEAYLNLTLPVSIAEHQIGRCLSSLVWYFIYCAVVLVSILALSISGILEISISDVIDLFEMIISEAHERGIPVGGFIITTLLSGIISAITIILALFFIKSVSHLVKKHRGLVEAVLVVGLIIASYTIIFSLVDMNVVEYLEDQEWADYMNAMLLYSWKLIGLNIAVSIAYFFGTNYILSNHLNLE